MTGLAIFFSSANDRPLIIDSWTTYYVEAMLHRYRCAMNVLNASHLLQISCPDDLQPDTSGYFSFGGLPRDV